MAELAAWRTSAPKWRISEFDKAQKQGEFRADCLWPHLQRVFDRGVGSQDPPLAHLLQERVSAHLRDASPQVVHSSAARTFAPTTDLHLEVGLRDRLAVLFPQHLTLHQTLQKGLRPYPVELSHGPSQGGGVAPCPPSTHPPSFTRMVMGDYKKMSRSLRLIFCYGAVLPIDS